MRKILIISHNPINKSDNMGKTIGNIFSAVPSEQLCQLFLKKQEIDSENCKEFYVVDDISVLKSIVKRTSKTGMAISANRYKFEENKVTEQQAAHYGAKRNGLTYFCRNVVWKFGKWNTKELQNWLAENKPNAIFYFAGDYTFSFEIAMKISKMLNIPLYIFFSDEYYRYMSKNIIDNIDKFFYRRKFKKAIKNCKEYFCITDEMAKFYEKEFCKKGNIIRNTTQYTVLPPKEDKSKICISYIGNLGYDRWKSLLDIANVINRVNNEKIELNIYSGEKDVSIIEKLKACKNIKYKGYINSSEIVEIMKKSDILLHAESFDPINIKKIKYSVSTKIPDSLASGRLLLVYGPKEIACVQYVEKNRVGIVAHNEEELIKFFKDYINNKIDETLILKRAQEIVKNNHRENSVQQILDKIGGNAVEDNSTD